MPGKQQLHRFIRSTFRSVWSLELLCHLRRHADRAWLPGELVEALRASDLIVSRGIGALTAAGLVVVLDDGAAHYRAATADLDALVVAADQLYAKSPNAVRRLIVSAANGDLATFADAFRVRGD